MCELKKNLDAFMAEQLYFEETFSDVAASWKNKGIVIPSGGRVYLTNAYMNIRYIREVLKSEIPIQIWMINKQEYVSNIVKKILPYDVKIISAEDYFSSKPMNIKVVENVVPKKSPASVFGWAFKVYTIINSPFAELLYLDSDCFLFQKPENLFESNEYKQTGALFGVDIDLHFKTSGRSVNPETHIVERLGKFCPNGNGINGKKWDYSKPNPIWNILGIKEDNRPEFETGFILVDKKKHYMPLFCTYFLNKNCHITYQFLFGDKDTFHLAWAKYNASCFMLDNVKRDRQHICSYYKDKILFEHRVYNTKFDPQKKWDEFPNSNSFHQREIFGQYFTEITCGPKIF